MNGLYPIIRRKRRPLLVADAPPVVTANVEPLVMEAGRAKDAKEAKAEKDAGQLSERQETD